MSRVKQKGFTIVELLIVIVVIGILASLAFIGYNGVQDQARIAKARADLTSVRDAVVIAREKKKMTLAQMLDGKIGYPYAVMINCVNKADGTDLAKLPKSDNCWFDYLTFLKVVSDASGIDLTGLTDPYGRPYYIDPNEGEPGYPACLGEGMGMFVYPYKSGYQMYAPTVVTVLPYDTKCPV